jgi:ribonuclease P protein component
MPLRGRESFPKTARLRKRPEFLRLSRTGHRVHSANFVVISRPNEQTESRLGITVSGKVGNSVVRNRIKRWVREFFRRRRHELPAAIDVLVIARKSATDLSFNFVKNELENILVNQRFRRKS